MWTLLFCSANIITHCVHVYVYVRLRMFVIHILYTDKVFSLNVWLFMASEMQASRGQMLPREENSTFINIYIHMC